MTNNNQSSSKTPNKSGSQSSDAAKDKSDPKKASETERKGGRS